MKPSYRIREMTTDIAKFPNRNWWTLELEDWVEWILKYLDEEYEKNNQ